MCFAHSHVGYRLLVRVSEIFKSYTVQTQVFPHMAVKTWDNMDAKWCDASQTACCFVLPDSLCVLLKYSLVKWHSDTNMSTAVNTRTWTQSEVYFTQFKWLICAVFDTVQIHLNRSQSAWAVIMILLQCSSVISI